MVTAAEITDPLVRTYTRVLPIGPGVCNVCHGAPGTGWERCWSCAQSVQGVSRPVELVVPISLTELLGQLHHVLRSYKRADYPEEVRSRLRLQVGALLARFLATHRSCVENSAGSSWDCTTIVPSSQGRLTAHPLEQVLALFPSLSREYRPLLRPGPETATHNHPSDRAYSVTTAVSGLKVLLLDDTFTSGARLQSAASALQLAGATVVAAVPIGRVVKPDFSPESAALLAKAREKSFDFDVCAVQR